MTDMPTMLTRYRLFLCARALPALLCLAGCTLALRAPEAPSATPPAASSAAPASVRPKPDAIYDLESGNAALPRSVNVSLEKIAAQVKANRDLVIRLESYTPSGGSREMNVSLATSAVERIRRRLVELGVPSYRISLAPLGEEHPEARRLNSKRVELFIVPLPR